MSEQTKKISYFNTLIFTIISGIVSLLLLAALFFDVFKDYMTFIITVEIGIFLVIGWSIWQIVSNEKRLEELRKKKNFTIDFTQCPDYYISRVVDGVTICSNEYIVEDQYRNKRLMKIYPADDISKNISYPLPKLHSNIYNKQTSRPVDKFDSTAIDSAGDLPDVQKKCGAVLGMNNTYKDYTQIPWVGVRARCESYAT